uniref:Uncharacterized protein n=1 Tax=Schistocephalus solidus TaxID=70667 RepID=A0A0X3Q6V5_SCHSO
MHSIELCSAFHSCLSCLLVPGFLSAESTLLLRLLLLLDSKTCHILFRILFLPQTGVILSMDSRTLINAAIISSATAYSFLFVTFTALESIRCVEFALFLVT